MRDEEDKEPASVPRKVLRTACFVVWMSASAYFGLNVLEFGTAVDGIGYGHFSAPSLITVGVAHVLAVIVALLAILVYRGRIGPILGGGLGLLFWLASFIVGSVSLGLHYERLCDTMHAPSACQYVATIDEEECVPYAESECAEDILRACKMGRGTACRRAVEKGVLPQSQACNILADRCDESRRCNSDSPPPACGGPNVPRLDDLNSLLVCDRFEEQCEKSAE